MVSGTTMSHTIIGVIIVASTIQKVWVAVASACVQIEVHASTVYNVHVVVRAGVQVKASAGAIQVWVAVGASVQIGLGAHPTLVMVGIFYT